MASKLSKSDYEKALSAEYGFPVFLRDDEYTRLSASKPLQKASGPYQDPFGHLDAPKKAREFTTAPGQTYNKVNNRPAKAPLAGVPAPAKPNDPGSASIGKLAPPSLPKDSDYAKGPPLTAATSMPVGVEYLNGVDPNPFVEDLGGDDRPNTLEQKVADQQAAELAGVGGAIAALPQTYKSPAAYIPTSQLPKWQSDEEEVNAMLNRYAALGGGK